MITINYHESYDIFACNGILFNHESPLRGLEFVTRKITNGLASIKKGNQSHIELGNLYAKEIEDMLMIMKGIWKMLQIDQPEVFVLATGRTTLLKI